MAPSKSIALGGILTALSLLILYLLLIVPTNTLTLFTVSSFLVCLAHLVVSTRTAWLVYVSTSLLSFFFIPLHFTVLYVLFFGCYGALKLRIESLNHRLLESFLKLAFLNSMFLITCLFLDKVLGLMIFEPFKLLVLNWFPDLSMLPLLIILGGIQIAFTLYDYGLTLLLELFTRYLPLP